MFYNYLAEVLNELGLYELSEELHAKCKSELEEVKEEYERYKLRAQSVLKSKSSKVDQLIHSFFY